jgi:hypothetical protein
MEGHAVMMKREVSRRIFEGRSRHAAVNARRMGKLLLQDRGPAVEGTSAILFLIKKD